MNKFSKLFLVILALVMLISPLSSVLAQASPNEPAINEDYQFSDPRTILNSIWHVTAGHQLWLFTSATAGDTGWRLNLGGRIVITATDPANGRHRVMTASGAFWMSSIAFNSGVLRLIN